MSIESGTPPRISSPPPAINVCPHCGSPDAIKDVKLSHTAESGSTGLNYTTGVLFRGTEPLLADLCRRCGTVVRLHVKQPDRNWVQN
jgi:uncharacterized OB-fold protein